MAAISNPVLTNPTKNGFPIAGQVEIPLASILYWFQTASGTTFYTESGVYQTSDTSFVTGFPQIACASITRKNGSVFKPTYQGYTFFNPESVVGAFVKDGYVTKIVFTWGEVTIKGYTFVQYKTDFAIISAIEGELTAGGTLFASTSYAQTLTARAIIMGGVVYPTTATPTIQDLTKKTYSTFFVYTDPVLATQDSFYAIKIKGVSYLADPLIALSDTASVQSFITDRLKKQLANYSTVSVGYTPASANNKPAVLSITIADCDTLIEAFSIDIDAGGSIAGSSFVVLNTSSVIVPHSTNYEEFGIYTDPAIGTPSTIVGITVDGATAITFPSAIDLTFANTDAIQNAIKAALSDNGYYVEDVQFKNQLASTNGKKATVRVIALGANVLMDRVDIEINGTTPASLNFTQI